MFRNFIVSWKRWSTGCPKPIAPCSCCGTLKASSTSETGEGLGIGDEAVKTRLHRARGMIRRAVSVRIGEVAADAFQFHAPRCNRVVSAVLAHIASCLLSP